MLEDFLVAGIILTTSLVAYLLLGRVSAPGARPPFRIALARFFECLGAFVVFFTMNVTMIIALGLFARTAGLAFISLYAARDVLLLILSAAQAVLFSFWRRMD